LGDAGFYLKFTIVLKKSYPERQREWPIDALATHIIRSDMKVPNPSITLHVHGKISQRRLIFCLRLLIFQAHLTSSGELFYFEYPRK
jgi:hypothetical protein